MAWLQRKVPGEHLVKGDWSRNARCRGTEEHVRWTPLKHKRSRNRFGFWSIWGSDFQIQDARLGKSIIPKPKGNTESQRLLFPGSSGKGSHPGHMSRCTSSSLGGRHTRVGTPTLLPLADPASQWKQAILASEATTWLYLLIYSFIFSSWSRERQI